MAHERAPLEEIIESADCLIVEVNSQGRIKLFNRKAREVTGYQPEEILGKLWIETLVPSEYQPRLREALKSLPDNQNPPHHGEYPIRSRDGKEVFIAWDRSFLRGESGKIEGIFSGEAGGYPGPYRPFSH